MWRRPARQPGAQPADDVLRVERFTVGAGALGGDLAPPPHPLLDLVPPAPVGTRLDQRQQGPQGFGRVAEQRYLDRVPHSEPSPVNPPTP